MKNELTCKNYNLEWNTTHLSFETEPEPYGKLRDTHITQMCHQLGVRVVSSCSHTLYNLEHILAKCGGTPKSFPHFQSVVASLDPPLAPKPRITLHHIDKAVSPIGEDHDIKYGIPTLDELGFDTLVHSRDTMGLAANHRPCSD